MKFLITIFLLSLFAACQNVDLVKISSNPGKVYLIKNVNIFTGKKGQEILQNMNVLIENGKIKKISKEELKIQGFTEIDGNGKTLLPGLIDFHTHVTAGMFIPWAVTLMPTQEFNLQAALYSGITTIVDMSGKDVSEMNALKQDLESGKIPGPRLFHAGVGFTAKGGHPIRYLDLIREKLIFLLHPFIPKVAIEMEENTRDFSKLEHHLKGKPDFTKIYVDKIPETANLISDELIKKIVTKSHDAKIPVVFHIGSNKNLESLIETGGNGAVHVVYKEKIDLSLVKKLAEKKIYIVPTIVVWDNYNEFANRKSYRHFTKLEYETMHPTRVDALSNPKDSGPAKKDWAESDANVQKNIPNLFSNVTELNKAGVRILAGSDAPNLGITLGGSLHTELNNLVKAGLTPTEALLSATSVPAEILDKDLSFGLVEEGKIADLLLVTGDPTKNISDTRNISEVFSKGRRIERLKSK